MRGKIGDGIAGDFFDRGRRELGGFLYPDSNIAQPLFPNRGGTIAPKEFEKHEHTPDAHIEQAEPSRDDRGRDEPDIDIDR